MQTVINLNCTTILMVNKDVYINMVNKDLQCNLRVAWTSSRMHAGKRRTLRATTCIVTIFSHMTRDVSVVVKCGTVFRLFFFWKLPQFHTYKFRKVVRQHTEGMMEVLRRFCWKFTWLSSSERILQIR